MGQDDDPSVELGAEASHHVDQHQRIARGRNVLEGVRSDLGSERVETHEHPVELSLVPRSTWNARPERDLFLDQAERSQAVEARRARSRTGGRVSVEATRT